MVKLISDAITETLAQTSGGYVALTEFVKHFPAGFSEICLDSTTTAENDGFATPVLHFGKNRTKFNLDFAPIYSKLSINPEGLDLEPMM